MTAKITITWHVEMHTMVSVDMPGDISPDTVDGLQAIRQAAKEKLLRAIEEDSFDIGCERYFG
jgi:hypothetical protein